MSISNSLPLDQHVVDTTEDLYSDTSTVTIRRRSTNLGHRHGLALGNAGVAVVGYSTGFASGFMDAFQTK